ncbi:MAG: hypothetical protein P8J86_10680 [Phycisphaerales bacterium]|nr:hypothetical protein [Phycisphaerales bacterium]
MSTYPREVGRPCLELAGGRNAYDLPLDTMWMIPERVGSGCLGLILPCYHIHSMPNPRMQPGLTRPTCDGFRYALGVLPQPGWCPIQGYTVTYQPGDSDGQDVYILDLTVSHERLEGLISDLMALLSHEVTAMFEIASRDAYRALDVFLGTQPIALSQFLAGWHKWSALILEDGMVGAGVCSEETLFEIFITQMKTVLVYVEPQMLPAVRQVLDRHDVVEVEETWPEPPSDEIDGGATFRSILESNHPMGGGLDEVLLSLENKWHLDLQIDPAASQDERGRILGPTLWFVLAKVRHRHSGRLGEAAIWMTADCLDNAYELTETFFETDQTNALIQIQSADRMAFDERPAQLVDLRLGNQQAEVHCIRIDQHPHQRANECRGHQNAS